MAGQKREAVFALDVPAIHVFSAFISDFQKFT
jgi:hypothetical protein